MKIKFKKIKFNSKLYIFPKICIITKYIELVEKKDFVIIIFHLKKNIYLFHITRFVN